MNKKSLIPLSLIFTVVVFTSCTSIKKVGDLNMISTRNIESKEDYKLLTTYSGGSKLDLRKSRAKTIQQAVDETVRKTVGGEYLMNVKIYLVNQQYYAIEGDVWGREGVETAEVSVNGFKVGDNVTWKINGMYKTGKIIALKDTYCLIEQDGNQKKIKKDYNRLTKLQQ